MYGRGYSSADLDNYITGHYGEDQFPDFCEECEKPAHKCTCDDEEQP